MGIWGEAFCQDLKASPIQELTDLFHIKKIVRGRGGILHNQEDRAGMFNESQSMTQQSTVAICQLQIAGF